MSKDLKSINFSIKPALQQVSKYKAILFFVFVALIYAFIVYRINVLSNAEPDPSTLSTASKLPAQPRIDPNAVQKIKDLQDNSVNVQSLFNQVRNNPFQE